MNERVPQLIEVWFDGACWPRNPGGHASYGYSIQFDGIEQKAGTGYVGFGDEMSNNVAEYCGVLAALEYLLERGHVGARVIVYGDSDLAIRQLSGRWKAKKGMYIPYYLRAMAAVVKFRDITFKWIPREQNEWADELSRDALAQRGIDTRTHRW